MGPKRPPHIPPELWKAYLRRYRRWAWWVGDIGGSHPDYPGMSSSCQHDGPAQGTSSSTGQPSNPLLPSMLPSIPPQPSHLSPLWATVASSSLPIAPTPPAQSNSHANHLGVTQSVGVPPQG